MKCWILTDFSKELQASVASKAKTDIGGLLDTLPEWCEVVNIYDLAIEIDAHGNGKIWHAGKYVDRPDAAVCLYVGLVAGLVSKYPVQILDQLESLGTFCMINSRQLMTTGDKLKCSQLLAKAGINTPKTVLLTDWIPTSMVVESLGLPMVVKPVDGSEGRGVCLVHSEEELKKMLAEKDAGTTLIAQQYISSSNYVLFRVAGAQQSQQLKELLDHRTLLGGQIAYYYNTIVGPLGATVGYSNRTKKPYVYLNLGYDF